MKQAILDIILTLADLLGFNYFFRKQTCEKVRILMYHGVTNRVYNPPYWTQLPLSKFVKQIRYVKKNFRVCQTSELLNDKPADYRAAITFDDGLRNVLYNALPVLKKENAKATCFVLPELSDIGEPIWPDKLYDIFTTTSEEFVDLTDFGFGKLILGKSAGETAKKLSFQLKEKSHFEREEVINYIIEKLAPEYIISNEDFELMSISQIRELSNSGCFEIAPHTNRHPILSTMSVSEQEEEINGSIRALKELELGNCKVFAYPNGREKDFDDTTIELLKRADVEMAFSTNDGFYSIGDDKYRINRIMIGSDISMAEFKARLSGLFYYLKGIR